MKERKTNIDYLAYVRQRSINNNRHGHYLHNKTNLLNAIRGSYVSDQLQPTGSPSTWNEVAWLYHIYNTGIIRIQYDLAWDTQQINDLIFRQDISLWAEGQTMTAWNVINNGQITIIKNNMHRHFHTTAIASLNVYKDQNLTIKIKRNNVGTINLNVLGVDIDWLKIPYA